MNMRGFITAGAMTLFVLTAWAVGLILESRRGTDQCLRREIFESCLKSTPRELQSVSGWAEVVSGCEDVAVKQSSKLWVQIKDGCR